VQGPFYAPANKATKDSRKKVMLVASGIGITPFFSVMATKVSDEHSFETDRAVFESLFNEKLVRNKTKQKRVTSTLPISDGLINVHPYISTSDLNILENNSREVSSTSLVETKDPHEAATDKRHVVSTLHVVWSVRDAAELMFYIDYVYQLVKHQNSLKQPVVIVDVYLTGLGNANDPKCMITQALYLLSLTSKTSDYMRIHFGRPKLDATVQEIKPDQIYYCGGNVLKTVLQDLCIEKSIEFHPEDFDAGASILPYAMKKSSSAFNKAYKWLADHTWNRGRNQSNRLRRASTIHQDHHHNAAGAVMV
jgi:hypothetical protein